MAVRPRRLLEEFPPDQSVNQMVGGGQAHLQPRSDEVNRDDRVLEEELQQAQEIADHLALSQQQSLVASSEDES
jgi:hypothetical protein